MTVTRSGRVLLHDSAGGLWVVSEAGKGRGPFDPAVPAGALVFGSETEDRFFFPAPSGWRDLAAHELEAALRAASLIGRGPRDGD